MNTENLESNREQRASIDGYRNYEISWWERVRNIDTNRILKLGTCTEGYLIASLYNNNQAKGHKTHQLVAREWVLNPEDKRCVDHTDGDKLNNHKGNLRFASHAENLRNQKKTNKPTSSIYKGASFHKPLQKWLVHIKLPGKAQHIGYFTNEREAAEAYNAAAREHYGDYAKLNTFNDFSVVYF